MREPHEFEAPLCAEVGGDYWFPEIEIGHHMQQTVGYAKSICGKCPHQTECAEWGIYNEHHGIWGGLTVRTRINIRRKKNIIIGRRNVA